MYTTNGQAKKLEDIPSEKDRSMFSCERYQFLLDAPFPISSECCKVMKKGPAHEFQKKTGKKAMTGQMASESRLRTQQWLNNGCNGFQMKLPISNPLSFWFEQDVLAYIYENKIQIAPPYGEVIKKNEVEGQLDFADLGIFDIGRPTFKTTGCNRTGCIFCGYGAHLEKKGDGRFERLKVTHPKIYEFVFKPEEEGGLGYKDKIDWLNENGNLHIRY